VPDEPSSSASARAPKRVSLTALSLKDLRNYPDLNLTIAAPLVVLTGANGVGKTNLLEAISLLTPGRGLRRAAYEDIARHGSAGTWAVAAIVSRNGEETRIGTGLTVAAPGEPRTRKVRINGATAATADALLDYLRVLWLTPATDGLFSGPAPERRRFLDRLVLSVDPGHAARVRDFERLVTQRNRLLAESGRPAWLEAVEAQLAEKAVAVALARAETVALLSIRIAAQAVASAAFPIGRIAVSGDFDKALASQSAAEAELWYRRVLARNRVADRAAGRTLEGPHRSDLDVVFAEKDMPAALSSTGEQKALLIGLILAHAGLVAELSGMTPILLLDEVAAHLDPGRRAALFERLAALGCQTFMTGADVALFDALPGAHEMFRIAGNGISQIERDTGR
jgi:DNA replication and repair protein RecF